MRESSAHSITGPDSDWIDQQCDQFERAWRLDQAPRIEDVVAAAPAALRQSLLVELLSVEIELRRRRGEVVERDAYRQRFPESAGLIDQLCPSVSLSGSATEVFNAAPTAADSTATTTNYRDLRLFKQGGLGVLYRATDQQLHREAVVKFINDRGLADPDQRVQFQVEAEITSRLDHPGVVPVYGIGEDGLRRPFYVMRLIHGQELRQAIKEFHAAGGPANHNREGRLQLFTLLEHLISACNTVAYAHDVGIVHCDIKPANIMIGKYGETFVLDWGLATSFERTTTFFKPNEPTVRPRSVPDGSTSGKRGGTYGYVSPEQLWSDDPPAPSCDIYSLGATLYEILTGHTPFNSRDPDVAEQIRDGSFRPPRSVQAAIPRRLEAICLKAISLAPRARYETAKHLAADLQNWMRDDEVQAAPDRLLDRAARFARRHRSMTIAGCVAAVAIALAAAWDDRTLKVAAHEQALRELVESNLAREGQMRKLVEGNFAKEEELRKLVEASFTTALDTFEELCRPLANGEMNNLGVFRPFSEKIKEFTAVYLEHFEDTPSMQLHTGRVYELRATLARMASTDTTSALDDYSRAEQIYQRLLASQANEPNYELRIARIHLSQGRLFLQRDEYDDAVRVLADASQRLEKLRRRQPDNLTLLRYLAEAYHCLGEVALDREAGGQRATALQESQTYFEQSQALREQLVKETDGTERRNHIRDLARSLGYLGDLYAAQGDIAEAARCYEESKAKREGLFHNNPLDPEHRFQYARSLSNFGFLRRGYGGNLSQAIDSLIEAGQIQEKLADDFPDVANFKFDLGSTQNLLAEVYLFAAATEPAKAEEFEKLSRQAATEAGKIYGRFYERKPSRDHRAIHGIATSFVLLATLDRTTNPRESQRLAADAEKLLREIGREPMLARSELVTLALAESLQNRPDQALKALTEAVERGENTVYRFTAHRDLGFKAIADDLVLAPQLDRLLQQMLTPIKAD